MDGWNITLDKQQMMIHMPGVIDQIIHPNTKQMCLSVSLKRDSIEKDHIKSIIHL